MTKLSGQGNYFFSKFTANDGLPSTKVYCSFQDSRGYIWICTNSGLSRYDGQRFLNYNLMDSLKANILFDIAEDRSKRIWVSTDNGQNVFNGKKFFDLKGYHSGTRNIIFSGDTSFLSTSIGMIKYYKTKVIDTVSVEDSTGVLKISTLHKSGNRIYLGTSNGIYFYENGKVKPFWLPTSPKYILSIEEDKKGNIWFCTLRGSVFFYKNGIFHRLDHKEEGNHNTFKLICNQEGDIVLVHGQYMSVYRNGKLLYFIKNFIEDKENVITDVMEDKEGNLWVSTIYGLFIGRKTQIKRIAFPRNSIRYMFKSEYTDDMYAVGNKNIYKLKNDTIYEEVFKDKPDQMGELEFVIEYKTEEFLFASTIGGIVQYRKGNYKRLTKGFIMFSSFIKDGDKVWLTSKRNLYVFEGDSLIPYDLKIPEASYIILDIIKANETDKLLATSKGIIRISAKDHQYIPLPHKTVSHPLLKKIVKINDSTFFIGTKGNGLLNITLSRDSAKINYGVNSKNSIINDDIIDFIVDEEKNIWLSTSRGLFKIYKINTPDQYIQSFGVEDGMPSHSWSFSYLFNNQKGFVYLSGSEGIAKFPLGLNSRTSVVQRTHINDIKVNGEKFSWDIADSLLNFDGMPSSYDFDHFQNAFTFHFIGINFYKPNKVVYQYNLEGIESDWTATKNSFVSYNNLSPGEYKLNVRSGTNLLNAQKQPITSFSFVISPPYWQTWWFKTLLAIVLSSLIYTVYRIRLKEQLKEQQRKLETVKQLNESKMMAFQARMNPHFVFNSLNSIQYFITNNDKVSTLKYLSKFAKLLRQIVDNSVHAKLYLDIEIEMLRSYMEMEELRFDKRFSFEIRVSEDIDPANIEIPGMILQPFVENAILHGLLHKKRDNGKLKVSINMEKKQIVCTIEDNGIGRAKSEELNKLKHRNHKSHGTKIATKRLEMMNNKEEGIINTVEFIDLVRDGQSNGTMVIIKLPIL